jgi:hypothetical protein
VLKVEHFSTLQWKVLKKTYEESIKGRAVLFRTDNAHKERKGIRMSV